MKRSKFVLLFSIIAISLLALMGTIGQVSASPTTYDYVIITTNDIVANSDRLEGFIRLKERFGYSVKVATETDFGVLSGQAPHGTAEKIRQWLINHQASLGIDYVLLIGNPDPDDPTDPSDTVGDIPMKMCWPGFESRGGREYPTDFFYADLTGNWDLDGDYYFGEHTAIDHPDKPSLLSNGDTFSINWTGQLDAQYNEIYSFLTFTDDGVRLWIDGDLVINEWASHPPTVYEGSKYLSAGKHSIEMHFYETTGDAIVQLFWKSEHQTDNKWQLIPKERLFHDGSGGLNGEYYENQDFTGTVHSRVDETINFLWLTGDRGSGGVDFEAEVYVGRIPVYDNDYAQLDHILQKMIDYETEEGDLSWRKKILLPAYPCDPATPGWYECEAIKDDIADPNGFYYHRIYNSSWGTPPPACETTPCTELNVENEWKKGYGMVAWFAHGSATSAQNVFSTPRCTNLDDTKPSFVFQCSCTNAHPETKTNLAYSLLKHGAVSTVGATRSSMYVGGWTSPNPARGCDQDVAYYYTQNIIADNDTAGEALFQTKDLNVDAASWKNLFAYNLYGDPACSLFETIVNNPPVADANGPYVASLGSTITLSASGSSDPDGDDIVKYEWDLDNDGTFEISTSSSTYSYTWSGEMLPGTVTLRVTDILGASSTDTTQITLFGVQLTLSPPSLDIVPGDTGTYDITVTNKGNVPDTFDLSLSGLPTTWVYTFSSSAVSLGPFGTITVQLSIEPYRHWSTSPGDYPFTVTATSQQAPLYGLTATDSTIGNVHVLPFHEVQISLTPSAVSVEPSQSASYTIGVTNLGNVQDSFDISLLFDDFDGAYQAFPTSIQLTWTTLDKTTITLDPGASDSDALTITAPHDWAGMEDATYEFTATATCLADPAANDSESAELTVQATKESMARYIDLELQWLTDMVNSSTIDETIKASLLDQLTEATKKKEQALDYILNGRIKPANNMLKACKRIIKAYIGLVEAQHDKYIPEAIANDWIAIAQAIVDHIETTIATPS